MPLRYEHASTERDQMLAEVVVPYVPLPGKKDEPFAPNPRPTDFEGYVDERKTGLYQGEAPGERLELST